MFILQVYSWLSLWLSYEIIKQQGPIELFMG